MNDTVRFLLDDEVVAVAAPDPTATLLDWLRYERRRTGTKEGCAEGDCGACTVLVGDARAGAIRWRAVNACILFLPMLDGKALRTVESLGGAHPLQATMAANGASQCGFCTPGFVMSLVGRAIGALGTEGVPVEDVIAGNLCRCTGYGPILDAGRAHGPVAADEDARALDAVRRDTMLALRHVDAITGRGRLAWSPRTADELAAILAEHPDAQIVAGATDVGLWVVKQHRDLAKLVFIGDLAELGIIEEAADALTIGAAARYSEARAALARLHPALGELLRRIGGVQVRNAGTIGGNIANGSPIGDMPPAMIALGASVTLRRGDARRVLPLERFFRSYGVQDRQPGEFVDSVRIPRPAPGTLFGATKLSKRFDSDISAVCGAFAIRVVDGVVESARVAFGGMAGVPARAPACEAALTGARWSEATIEAAAAALATDYRPLNDPRGSAAYRVKVAGNLLRRLWHEQASQGESVSVLDTALA